MITITQIKIIVLCTLLPLVGCVKVQLKPQKLVNDTVTACKSLYETIKRKKDGTEERLYSHTVELKPDADQQEIATRCLTHLEAVAQSSTDNDVKILEQATEVLFLHSGERMKCTLLAVV